MRTIEVSGGKVWEICPCRICVEKRRQRAEDELRARAVATADALLRVFGMGRAK
jgi:hypothetical protein